MRVLVTGALGHIGSRLVRDFARRFKGGRISMLDDLSTQRYSSLFDLPDGISYRFVQGDVTNFSLGPLVSDADVTIHLAAITDAPRSFERPEEVERVNLEGTRAVAKACVAAGVPMIFPSTTSVYGSQENLVDETCPVSDLKPQSPYAESKLRSERMLEEMARDDGLRVSILRLGTIFGHSPGMRFHTSVNKFCWQAVLGESITVWRTALDQHRPYLDLGDAIDAFGFVIEKGLFDGRVYNVVTVNTSPRNIVAILSKHFPGLSVVFIDTPIMNQLSYNVSAQRFKDLGFEFTGNLERGIDETVSLLRRVRP